MRFDTIFLEERFFLLLDLDVPLIDLLCTLELSLTDLLDVNL